MVKLVFLGKFRGLAREDFETALPAEVRTLSDLQAWIGRRDPALGSALEGTRTQYVVNQMVVRDLALPVHDRDEIAFLPPMSGG